MAQRFLDVYEAFQDEAARLLGASLPDEWRKAQVAAAEFGSDAVQQIRTFVAECVDQMSGLPELVKGRSEDDEPIRLELTLTPTINEDVLRRFEEGLAEGVASL